MKSTCCACNLALKCADHENLLMKTHGGMDSCSECIYRLEMRTVTYLVVNSKKIYRIENTEIRVSVLNSLPDKAILL